MGETNEPATTDEKADRTPKGTVLGMPPIMRAPAQPENATAEVEGADAAASDRTT